MMMKTLKTTVRLYFQHFFPLMLMLFVQLLLRALALTPLMFLADKELADLAWLAIPAYLLIVLVARQNMAEVLADLAKGKISLFKMLSMQNYGRKLLRGLLGTLKLLIWAAVPAACVAWLVMSIKGVGGMNGFELLRLFGKIGKVFGGDTLTGIKMMGLTIAATFLLPMVGCAVHCGYRHARAQGKRQSGGVRFTIFLTWFVTLLLLLPGCAVIALTLSDYIKGAIDGFMKTLQFSALAITTRQIWTIVGAVAVLMLPVVPLRSLLPAVCLEVRK